MAFEAGDGRDDELVSARLFELLELGGQARFLGRRNDVRLIDDASGQLGKALRGGGGGDKRHSERPAEQQRLHGVSPVCAAMASIPSERPPASSPFAKWGCRSEDRGCGKGGGS